MRMPSRASSAASWLADGLPVVSNCSPTKIEFAPATKHSACNSSLILVRPAESRTTEAGMRMSSSLSRAGRTPGWPGTRGAAVIASDGWRRTWLVNGSSRGLVRLELEPAAPAKLLGVVPLKVSTLRVSVDDPDALVATLGG